MTRPTIRQREALRISESALHKSVAQYLALRIRPPVIWTTLGHGGGGRVRGAQLKAMGLRKGWPDILIMAPGPVVLGIELKRDDKKATQTPEQVDIEMAFAECNAWYVVCRSLDAVKCALHFLGLVK